jgi:hypothetical protein
MAAFVRFALAVGSVICAKLATSVLSNDMEKLYASENRRRRYS